MAAARTDGGNGLVAVGLGQLPSGPLGPSIHIRSYSGDDSCGFRTPCAPASLSPREGAHRGLERQGSSASMASSSGSSSRWQDEPSHAELLAKFERHGAAGTQAASSLGLGRRIERAARTAVDALRNLQGGTTAFGVAWFVGCG